LIDAVIRLTFCPLMGQQPASAAIRILHLVDLDAGFQARRGAENLARELGAGFEAHMRTVGRGGDFASAIAAITRASCDPDCNIVHAWGPRALAAAALAHRRTPIVHTPADEPSRRWARWLRAIMSHRSDMQAICPTATLRRQFVESGVRLDRCHLIRPGVDFARVRRRRDPALREALGIGDADRVMLLAGESTRAAGHRQAMWAAAILGVLDPRYRALAWGRGADLPALIHFAQTQKQPDLLIVAEPRLGRRLEFEELLPAADLILATPISPAATLPISIAMAAALPIVATTSYTTGELLEDRHTALLVAPGSVKALTRRVLDLEQDSNVQWAICDMARTEAYEYFSLTRFVNQFRQVYRQIAEGQKVEVPEQRPGAGMRFHGRA
jgi:glycosyltransferase involved in cell wall biosynthesis